MVALVPFMAVVVALVVDGTGSGWCSHINGGGGDPWHRNAVVDVADGGHDGCVVPDGHGGCHCIGGGGGHRPYHVRVCMLLWS